VLTPRRLRILGANPLDLVRKKLTSGLQVDAAEGPVRRGGEVEALVTISDPAKAGSVEVGLVCTEYFDEDVEQTYRDSDGVQQMQSSRETLEATAHEQWRPLESAAGVQSVRFTIPEKAPFSYEGDCLSFRWEVVARGRRHQRLDALTATTISVDP
jgi:hypothetical protein